MSRWRLWLWAAGTVGATWWWDATTPLPWWHTPVVGVVAAVMLFAAFARRYDQGDGGSSG